MIAALLITGVFGFLCYAICKVAGESDKQIEGRSDEDEEMD